MIIFSIFTETIIDNFNLTIKNKFFMGGTIGTFAEESIGQLKKDLAEEMNVNPPHDEVWYEDIESRITVIGETLLRDILWEKYMSIPHVKSRKDNIDKKLRLERVQKIFSSLDEESKKAFLLANPIEE